MMSMIKADIEDADVVGAVTACSWQAVYKGIIPDEYLQTITPESRAERFRTVLPHLPDVEFYLAMIDDKPAGAMNVHPCRDEDAKDCGEIGVFYFLAEFWGRGYAAGAMQFMLNRLKEWGFSSATLWVLEENHRARRFYEKQGFRDDGGRKTISLGREFVGIRYRISLLENGQ